MDDKTLSPLLYSDFEDPGETPSGHVCEDNWVWTSGERSSTKTFYQLLVLSALRMEFPGNPGTVCGRK